MLANMCRKKRCCTTRVLNCHGRVFQNDPAEPDCEKLLRVLLGDEQNTSGSIQFCDAVFEIKETPVLAVSKPVQFARCKFLSGRVRLRAQTAVANVVLESCEIHHITMAAKNAAKPGAFLNCSARSSARITDTTFHAVLQGSIREERSHGE